jgi:hypothetical protein
VIDVRHAAGYTVLVSEIFVSGAVNLHAKLF